MVALEDEMKENYWSLKDRELTKDNINILYKKILGDIQEDYNMIPKLLQKDPIASIFCKICFDINCRFMGFNEALECERKRLSLGKE